MGVKGVVVAIDHQRWTRFFLSVDRDIIISSFSHDDRVLTGQCGNFFACVQISNHF